MGCVEKIFQDRSPPLSVISPPLTAEGAEYCCYHGDERPFRAENRGYSPPTRLMQRLVTQEKETMVVAAKKAKATGAKRGRPPLKVPTASQARAGGEWPTSGMAMINEVAAFFRCSRSTVGKMIDDGRIEAVLVGSDRRVIWESVWNYVRKANGGRPRGEASGNGPLTTGN